MPTITDNALLSPQLSILQIDSLQLSIPQNQIASVNLVDDLNTDMSEQANIGSIMNDKLIWPIYAISNSLSILSSLPGQSRFCVCFHPTDSQRYFGLVVDAILTFELQDSSIVQPLPDCMHNPQSPITQLFKNDGKLIFISDVENLHRFIDYQESRP